MKIMAKFKFKHAVMSAGKSQELARVRYNYLIKGEDVLVLVPTLDTRAGTGYVYARSGEKFKAEAVDVGTLENWLTNYFETERNIACILLDEVQFFSREDIFALKNIVLEKDIPVIAYGLKTDFQNNLFEGSAACLVVAEETIEIETVCSFCNKRAIMNLRISDGKPVREGEQVLIGDDEYLQVCHYHYLQDELPELVRRKI